MTEIPEHLRKRAEEAKAKAAAKKAAESGGDAPAADAPAASADAGDSRIPEALLARSKAARERAAGGGGDAPAEGGGGVATAERPAGAAVAPAGGAGAPLATGPEGHTQRLLTVVKAGSIQDVKAKPVDKVHTWPHLLVAEFVAALALTAFLLVFSAFVNAPLLTLANYNLTPNPSKAPWYFLGLQELLTMFHPMVAGVTIPGMGLAALMLAPYIDKNPSNKPEDRKFAISIMTIHLMFWAVLVIIGSFFRGPGQNFVFPWTDGIFFEL
ncbi:MAG TPA: menaquinol-cytochrome c reductase cytochrome b subunit [Acidimicrobiales bacterium]|jgi:menaquinol-cytochrome c reductase cytochrome b/c subunit|nr:menaquinol-cytochrome c reductase cytochrome b subunit [Acidimicrobiales bacterium]